MLYENRKLVVISLVSILPFFSVNEVVAEENAFANDPLAGVAETSTAEQQAQVGGDGWKSSIGFIWSHRDYTILGAQFLACKAIGAVGCGQVYVESANELVNRDGYNFATK